MDDSREESEATVAPATNPTLRGVHIGVQIAWFILLAMFCVSLALSFDEGCGDGEFCIGSDVVGLFVLTVGPVVWGVGASVIALVFAAIHWVVRRVRGSGAPGDPA